MHKQKYDELMDIFTRTANRVQILLCEIRTALGQLGAKPYIVNIDVMTDNYKRDNFRDWVIFREYANQLEYMQKVFETIKDTLHEYNQTTNDE